MHMLHTGLVASHGMKRNASGLPATVLHGENVKISTKKRKYVVDCMKIKR